MLTLRKPFVMMKVFLVDDEQNNLDNLQFMLENDCTDVQVVGTATHGEAARVQLSKLKIDILFLDISMPGETGFEMLEKIENRNFEVVFVTAHNEYGIKAIKASAIDYLLKPVGIDELNTTVERIKVMLRNNSIDNNKVDVLLKSLLNSTQAKKIAVPLSGKTRVLDSDQIVSLQADGNYSIIYLQSFEKLVISKSLKDFDEILDDQQFFRIHKSTIININHIVEIINTDGGSVRMNDGTILSVSRRQHELFQEKLKTSNVLYLK